MICIKCKKEIPNGSAFCNHCGKKQGQPAKRRARKRPEGTGTIRKDERNKQRPWVAVSPSSKYGTSRVYLGAFRTYKEAQDAIEKYNREGRPELYGATLEDVYKLWSSTHYKSISPSSVSSYENVWKQFSSIKSMKMEDVRTIHFQDIVDKSSSKSYASIIKMMASMLCKYAMQNDIISKNYAEFVKKPKFDKKEKTIFSQQQISTLWKASDDDRARYILFMIYTGLRIGEFAALKPSDLHLDDGYIICGEKTEAGKNRIVPLPSSIPELTEWLEEWSSEAVAMRKKTIVGRSIHSIREDRFYPILEQLGILKPGDRTLTPHSCRHTFASMSAAAGMPPEMLQKIIGHANYQTTADIYIHSDLDVLKEAMSKLKK